MESVNYGKKFYNIAPPDVKLKYLVLVDVVADEGVHPRFDSRLDRRLTKLIHALVDFY
jgi:hypothetical protein